MLREDSNPCKRQLYNYQPCDNTTRPCEVLQKTCFYFFTCLLMRECYAFTRVDCYCRQRIQFETNNGALPLTMRFIYKTSRPVHIDGKSLRLRLNIQRGIIREEVSYRKMTLVLYRKCINLPYYDIYFNVYVQAY